MYGSNEIVYAAGFQGQKLIFFFYPIIFDIIITFKNPKMPSHTVSYKISTGRALTNMWDDIPQCFLRIPHKWF